jgi:putative transposase
MALSEKESVVRKSRFSEEKMVQILREADRTPIGEVAKQHGISEQTIYNWRRHFGSMDSASAARAAQKTRGKQQAACVCAGQTRSGLGV